MAHKLVATFIVTLFVVLCSFCATVRDAGAARCSFENAVDIQTALFIANFDYSSGGMTQQAPQAKQAQLDRLRAGVPEACTYEVAASASNAELSRICAPVINAVLPTIFLSFARLRESYAATGNQTALIYGARAMFAQYVRSVPSECWFASVQRAALVPDPPRYQNAPAAVGPGIGLCGPSGCRAAPIAPTGPFDPCRLSKC